MNLGNLSLGDLAAVDTEELEGLSDVELEGLLASLEDLDEAQLGAVGKKKRAKARAKITGAIARKHGKKGGAMAVPKSNNINGETRFLTDKALFENRLSQLKPEIVTNLKKGLLQICDWSFYSVKKISGLTNIKMFEDGDTTSIALTNVVQGRMFPEDHFLATSLRVTTAEGAAGADGKGLHYGLPADCVVNGEFKLGQESTVYMEKTSANIFANGNRTDINLGEYRLEAPKMFYPQRTLKWEFDLASAAPENTWMRVEIRGVRTMKA